MLMISNFWKIFLIVVACLLAAALLVLAVLYIATWPVDYAPTSGQWYCEEIQVYLCFSSQQKNSYAIYQGEKVSCAFCHMVRSKDYRIALIDPETGVMDDHILKGEILRKTRDTFVLEDEITGNIYTFTKVDNTQKTGG